jgi:hypothetical protein
MKKDKHRMKVAVLYTGALRTIRKTMGYLKKNVLLGPHVHIYACLQNDTKQSNADMEAWIRQELSPHLQRFQWFDIQNYSELVILREKNLEYSTISNRWKDYLRNSGSIIEYQQLQLCYKDLFLREQQQHIEYDYIIRMRPDNMFAKPIDFHWLQWTPEEIETRIQRLHHQMEANKIEITPNTTLQYLMNTILDDQLLENLRNLIGPFVPNPRVPIPMTAKDIHEYITNGSYILTYRANNLYIVRRNLFPMIPALFSMYGLLKRPNQDEYWFNAENQFQYACYYAGLAIHDYNTIFEDKSLYEYKDNMFFDKNEEVINPMMVYCLVRA